MQIIIEVPEAYEDSTHVVLVAPGDDHDRYVTVLRVTDGVARLAEEVGGGGLTELLTLAAKVIRQDAS